MRYCTIKDFKGIEYDFIDGTNKKRILYYVQKTSPSILCKIVSMIKFTQNLNFSSNELPKSNKIETEIINFYK